MIDYIDNFFDQDVYYSIVDYCLRAPYSFGETDNPNQPPTGMVSHFDPEHELYTTINESINSKISAVQKLNLYTMNINYFAPCENPYFHTDAEYGITCLYYLGPIKAMKQRWMSPKYTIDDNGETQFFVNKKSINILPIANRMCFFDASILHRATSFRNCYRFTIAIKYR